MNSSFLYQSSGQMIYMVYLSVYDSHPTTAIFSMCQTPCYYGLPEVDNNFIFSMSRAQWMPGLYFKKIVEKTGHRLFDICP
jgi:hypothetical protein